MRTHIRTFALIVILSLRLSLSVTDSNDDERKHKENTEEETNKDQQGPAEGREGGLYPQCICKPSMRIELLENGGGGGRLICNNATVNWLLNTALEKISTQTDWIEELMAELRNAEAELNRGSDLVTSCEEETRRLRQENERLKSEVEEGVGRILELEEKLRRLTVESERDGMHVVQKMDDGRMEEEKTTHDHWKFKAKRLPRDCSDVQDSGMKYSGIYTIYPTQSHSPGVVEVFCDLNTDGGRWTVIQRRQDGSESFERSWEEYKKGFGVLAKEFWLGNENIHLISNQRNLPLSSSSSSSSSYSSSTFYELRIDMIDFDSVDYFAIYRDFSIRDESDEFRLSVGEFDGNAGDSLSSHDGWAFSTRERDNDGSRSGNCSELFGGGGWWFSRCYDSNLNGRYNDQDVAKTIVWYRLPKKDGRDGINSLRSVEMKIRPRRL